MKSSPTKDEQADAEIIEAGLVSEKQLDFLRGSSRRVNICTGAIRSGKTIVTLLRWLLFLSVAPKTGELVMVGRTRDAVWRNCVLPLQSPELFGRVASNNVQGNYGAPTVNILGRRVHILGASDVKAEKVIRGMTVAGAYVDEATTLPEEFFTQLLGRMSVSRSRMFATTNPDNPAHWLKTKFITRADDGELDDWRHWHFTLEDNPSLTEEYKASVRSEFTGLWYRRFILGEWVAAEGSVYDMWDPTEHVVATEEIPPIEELIAIGLDYGTSNATAAVLLGLGEDQRLYVLEEFTWDAREQRRSLTDAELGDRIEAWIERGAITAPRLEPRFTIVDPSALAFRTELSRRGIPTTPGDNDVAYGIQTIATLLSTGNLKVAEHCSKLIGEFPGYAWDPKATEKGEDKPIAVSDHHLDALRYALVTTENIWSFRVRSEAEEEELYG